MVATEVTVICSSAITAFISFRKDTLFCKADLGYDHDLRSKIFRSLPVACYVRNSL